MPVWQLQHAKARLSEVIERAETEGPQMITRHGAERAVVLSVEDYRALLAQKPEARKLQPADGVVAFFAASDAARLFASALTLGELRKGVAVRHRIDPVSADQIGTWVDGIETEFADRVLPVDVVVARIWGELSNGRSLPVVDTLIAATAIAGGLVLVTRNTRDVAATGVSLLDSWIG
jgi:toxin FitB